MKWILMVYVASSMPAPVGHFATREACLDAVLQVRVPEIGLEGAIEEYASFNAKNITMFCAPVERLMHEKALGSVD